MTKSTLRVVNMIPAGLSGETGQDSEPNLAVDPQNPARIVATAFEEQRLRDWLTPRVAALGAARVDALAICGEEAPGASFHVIERIALQGAKAA